MWIVRWVVMVVIILAVLSFALQNQEQQVVLHMGSWQSPSIPIYMALFVAFAIGMISFLLLAVFQQLQVVSDLARSQRALTRAQRRVETLEKQVEELKTLLGERTRERDEAFEKIQGVLGDHGVMLPPGNWDEEVAEEETAESSLNLVEPAEADPEKETAPASSGTETEEEEGRQDDLLQTG